MPQPPSLSTTHPEFQMHWRCIPCLQSLARIGTVVIATALSAAVSAAEKVDYTRDVKPLLQHCYSCHGAVRRQSGLRVDTAAGLRKGGDSGAAIVPGKSAESLLIHALAGTNDASRMPPEENGAPLTQTAIDTIRTWIDQGAEAPAESEPIGPQDHWAYLPVQRPELPAVRESGWAINAVDLFLLAEQESLGLQHAPMAAREVLLRRVYLDLIGLPPTPDDLRAFLADEAPEAYEKVVDRLLDSPQYGERWGRHWMDVWRYSDWAGYGAEIRESQYHIWRWRDWIIESLNTDKAYDEMVREMIAGDELAPTDPDVLRATGYLGRNWFKFNRNVWLDNTVEHVGKALLGMTFNCARCHDHKYDPFSQQEYYRLRAIFEPYDVRYDRVGGQPDVTKGGIARVFDKRVDDPTYLFVRGDEQAPDKEHPQPPALPEFFAAPFVPERVALPLGSFYPALSSEQLAEARSQFEAGVGMAEKSLAKASAELSHSQKQLAGLAANPKAELPSDPIQARTTLEQAIRIGEATVGMENKRLEAARAELAAFDQRLEAERAKYGLNPQADRDSLARSASQTERKAAALRAEFQVLEAERNLAVAGDKPANDKSKKAIPELQKKLESARAAAEAANKLRSSDSDQYSPLGDVYPQSSTGRRLALANWISNRNNPLTARVAVNHIWLRHFGRPLVPTVFDFGMNGKPPSHPRILDWLASEFIDQGWRMKPIHRLLVTSAAYRQSSSTTDFAMPPTDQQARDPDNRFLWRMNSRRLEAEIVRDSLLSVAGSLVDQMGGPDLDQNQGQQVLRRSVYFRHAKEKEMVFTKLFDGPGVSECYQRDESVVPQQALALANSPLGKNQSRLLAAELSRRNGGGQDEPFLVAAFEQILTRTPAADELAICRDFLRSQAQLFAEPQKLTTATVGEPGTIPASAAPEQRARENLVHVLLNHHEFVTVR